MDGVLYIGHGSRSKKGADEAKKFLEQIIEKVPVPIQEISFLELAAPSIEEGFERCVMRGATSIAVVPLFLLTAGHVKKDIPEIIKKLAGKYPEIKIDLKDALGVQKPIIDCMAKMVREIAGETNQDDVVLIVGRGSSDPEIPLAFSEIKEKLAVQLQVNDISACFLAACEPDFQQGLEWAAKEKERRIIIVPYLLFPGVLLSTIEKAVKSYEKEGFTIFQTGPLSRHEAFKKVVIDHVLKLD